jgi:formylglycine-generating enzyme required for sulfatase activity
MRRLLLVVLAVGLFVSTVFAAPRHFWKPAKAQLAAARKIGKPVIMKNSIGMRFRLIPAGSFVMGSPVTEPGRDSDEGPRHRVVISRSFYMQTTEVTQAQWRAIMGTNPSSFKGCDQCPVDLVSWEDAREFIKRLNAREKTDKYRLPTEAEWEYACRAGTRTAYCFGDNPGRLGAYAWYRGNSGEKTHPVARKRPNRWGLYDMHGNVWEWCLDWHGEGRYYGHSPARDPQGPALGRFRVYRGGSWGDNPSTLRSACRSASCPGNHYDYYGFRVVRIR